MLTRWWPRAPAAGRYRVVKTTASPCSSCTTLPRASQRASRSRGLARSPARRARPPCRPSRSGPAGRRSTRSRRVGLADLARAVADGAGVLHRSEDHAVVRAHVTPVDAAHAADNVGARAAFVDRRGPLEGQEPALHVRSEEIAAEPAARLQHAVTGHDEGHGIPSERSADGPHRARVADAPGDPGV